MQNKTVHIIDEACLEGYNQKIAYIPTLHTIARRLGLAMGDKCKVDRQYL